MVCRSRTVVRTRVQRIARKRGIGIELQRPGTEWPLYRRRFSAGVVYALGGGSPIKLDISASFIVQLDGKGNGVGTITDIIADANGAFPATLCVYATTGTYSLNTDGTSTATFNLTTTSPGCSDGQETYALTYLGNGSKYCGVVTGFTFPPGVDVSSIVGSFCAVKQ